MTSISQLRTNAPKRKRLRPIRTHRAPQAWRRAALLLMLAGAVSLPLGCSREETGQRSKVIRVWCHQGQEAENRAMRDMVQAFNKAHSPEGVRVKMEFFPDKQYTEKLISAAAVGDLPDALDLDGPLVAQFVQAGLLRPLDPWFDEQVREDFIPTILQQGTIDGKLYALGAFDSALVLYYDKNMLAKAGVEPPPPEQAWEWGQFLHACRQLKEAGRDPLAMHMGDSSDEWFTYAFSPVIWSAGGALISPDGGKVEGVLNLPTNVAALKQWQRIFQEDLAATDPVNPDPFGSGETAMDWTGHWLAPSHLEKKGEALGAMPLPKMGEEKVAPCGSWCWGVSSAAEDPDTAVLWVKWATDPIHGIKPIVEANGAIPARKSAFGEFPEYERMPYRLFRQQLLHWARPRPRTPHYATLTQQFAAALRDIARGADVQQRLDEAAQAVQRVIDRDR